MFGKQCSEEIAESPQVDEETIKQVETQLSRSIRNRENSTPQILEKSLKLDPKWSKN